MLITKASKPLYQSEAQYMTVQWYENKFNLHMNVILFLLKTRFEKEAYDNSEVLQMRIRKKQQGNILVYSVNSD